MALWWDGCYAAGDGCANCFFYGKNSKRCGQNTIIKADDKVFYSPLDKQKYKSGDMIAPCLSSDFFIPEADEWRKDAWSIIKQRPDLIFHIVTKRIDRFLISLPDDWGDGYDNVAVFCGVEDRETADFRLPLFLSYPIKYKCINCVPLIGRVDLSPYLQGVKRVTVGGEWGPEARELDFDWALDVKRQCEDAGCSFNFYRTGQRFRKNGVLHKISPYRKKAALKDLGIENIGLYIKEDLSKALTEKNIYINPEPDREFLFAFDERMSKLGYDFDFIIGNGTEDAPYIIVYNKTGTQSNYGARVFIADGRVMLRFYPNKFTPHFKYINAAPECIINIFTAHHDGCASCASPCRTREKYKINGRYVEKCRSYWDLWPSSKDLPDYMNLFSEFFSREDYNSTE